jgi:alkanesulfonate monooxygenase SsuD/methylene tetrahydromethanopterin reductase-like flavin-dependent oxidoreductase (luciferase family)
MTSHLWSTSRDEGVSTVRYGIVILPEHRWSRARGQWCRAEEFGFDHAWTYDHLMWRWLRDGPWYGSVPTLTAAATATSRIRLGMLVASPNLRHPVTFAKELMTLDDISGGRLICGVGAGAGEYDEKVFGGCRLSPCERADRLAEFLELTDLLLRQTVTSYDGVHYRARDARMNPGCVQSPRVPFAVAASGPRGMRLAARFAATWITPGTPGRFDSEPYERALPTLKEQLATLDEGCDAAGRDPATLDRLLVTGAMVGGVLDSAEAFRDAVGRFADIGFTDVLVHWPRDSFPYEGSVDVLEEIADTVLRRPDEPASLRR